MVKGTALSGTMASVVDPSTSGWPARTRALGPGPSPTSKRMPKPCARALAATSVSCPPEVRYSRLSRNSVAAKTGKLCRCNPRPRLSRYEKRPNMPAK
jgi:hypothetical protein